MLDIDNQEEDDDDMILDGPLGENENQEEYIKKKKDKKKERIGILPERVLPSGQGVEQFLNQLKRQAKEEGFPLIEEYDFKRDNATPELKIDLKPNTHVRDYQEQALRKMFSNGRARSGIIVLPCGAGKTLTGITVACTIKKSVIVVCTSMVSAEQWKREFIKWSLINPSDILIFTS